MTRQQAIEFLTDECDTTDYVTYGLEGSDLGTPIVVEEAIFDIMNMDDDSWNNAEIYLI